MSRWNERQRSGRKGARGRMIPRLLHWLFGGPACTVVVSTQINLAADPDTVWNRIVLYEDTIGRPPLLLRLFMPHAIRTEGDKSRTGALVRCIYDGGDLVKRIVALEPPYRMVFDVLEQRLGIEGCVVAQKGSYEIDSNGEGSDVILTTQYWAFLHPRWLWRSIEHVVASQLHLHILNAMRGCETERALAAESTGPELSANVTTADLATKPGEVAQRGGSRLAV